MATRTYQATVLKTKQEDFLNVLQELGIKKEELEVTGNKDFYLYKIDLSKKNNSTFSTIRRKLNEDLSQFL